MLAIHTRSKSEVSRLLTIINKGYIWQQRKFVQQLVGHAIPLGSTSSLLILNTSSNGSSLIASIRINQRRDGISSQFYLSILNSIQIFWYKLHEILSCANILELHDRSSRGRNHSSRDIEMIRIFQQCEHIVVNHLTNRHSRRHWADIW